MGFTEASRESAVEVVAVETSQIVVASVGQLPSADISLSSYERQLH